MTLAACISIHALLAESDFILTILICTVSKFLSTLSLRRATVLSQPSKHRALISIHALLAESDVNRDIANGEREKFLSTLSLRRATPKVLRHCTTYLFLSTLSLRRATRFGRPIDVQLVFLSTLSLRRATLATWKSYHVCGNFYPRSPCGERPTTIITICIAAKFLSTLSLRRATQTCRAKL